MNFKEKTISSLFDNINGFVFSMEVIDKNVYILTDKKMYLYYSENNVLEE